MLITRRLRTHSLRAVIARQSACYKEQSSDEIRRWQLQQFNRQWAQTIESVPHFRELKQAKNLPDRFEGWQAFHDRIPLMDRGLVQQRLAELTSTVGSPDQWRSTGGSTAEPLRIPVWRSEPSIASGDMWYARSWFGVTPSDKLFLLWGHSHLLGSGLRGRWNECRRRMQDLLLGYRRWSAYEMSHESLRKAGAALLRFRPSYLLGYSVALDRLARANRDCADKFKRLKLKVVIATAESFPRQDSARTIADVFNCPVAMEYGTVETGPIAHQRPDGIYSVFWRNYYVEALPYDDLPGRYEILVTSLYPRCVPLIRYRLGDLIKPEPSVDNVATRFAAVSGRCNEMVQLASGRRIHSEAFTHALKESCIECFQVVQRSDTEITIRYAAKAPLGTGDTESIRRRFGRITPELKHVQMERVDSLDKTVAGKTRRFLNTCESAAEVLVAGRQAPAD